MDGLGALVSTVFLGVILVRLKDIIGMPPAILYLLACLALLFAAYSLTCYYLKSSDKKYLRIIAVINTCYCLLTLGLIISFFESLTFLGLSYFVIEMIIILTLVRLEWNHSKYS
ncbi:MAG: hypothetical protein ABJG47_16760 [Ekhidna sp.]